MLPVFAALYLSYPRYSLAIGLIGYQPLIVWITSAVLTPASRAALRTMRENSSGSSSRIFLSAIFNNSGVPAFGFEFSEKQALFSKAMNGADSLTRGPSTFRDACMGTTSIGCGVRLVLLCSFAAGFNRERVELSTRNLSKLSCPVFRDEIRPLAYSSFGDAKGQSCFNSSAEKTDNIRFFSGHFSWWSHNIFALWSLF